MSLESGTTLWRLNHELLPEPGSPMARTTTPFGGRGGTAGIAGTLGADATGEVTAGSSASPVSENSPSAPSTGTTGIDPFAAAGAKACATACSRPRPPRPRPPRRRRPRPVDPDPVGAGCGAGCASDRSSEVCSSTFERALRTGRTSSTGGCGAEISGSIFPASGAAVGDCSASK